MFWMVNSIGQANEPALLFASVDNESGRCAPKYYITSPAKSQEKIV